MRKSFVPYNSVVQGAELIQSSDFFLFHTHCPIKLAASGEHTPLPEPTQDEVLHRLYETSCRISPTVYDLAIAPFLQEMQTVTNLTHRQRGDIQNCASRALLTSSGNKHLAPTRYYSPRTTPMAPSVGSNSSPAHLPPPPSVAPPKTSGKNEAEDNSPTDMDVLEDVLRLSDLMVEPLNAAEVLVMIGDITTSRFGERSPEAQILQTRVVAALTRHFFPEVCWPVIGLSPDMLSESIADEAPAVKPCMAKARCVGAVTRLSFSAPAAPGDTRTQPVARIELCTQHCALVSSVHMIAHQDLLLEGSDEEKQATLVEVVKFLREHIMPLVQNKPEMEVTPSIMAEYEDELLPLHSLDKWNRETALVREKWQALGSVIMWATEMLRKKRARPSAPTAHRKTPPAPSSSSSSASSGSTRTKQQKTSHVAP